MRPQFDRAPAWIARVRHALTRMRHAWLGVLGAPDYRAYLVHHRAHHPDRPPLSESDYARRFIERRYGGRGGGGRCC
jgi:uncharacterized short protein YbdD (DUF466 family)